MKKYFSAFKTRYIERGSIKKVAVIMIAILLFLSLPLQSFAGVQTLPPDEYSQYEDVSKYGYRTETFSETDRTYRSLGLITRVTLPYYLGKVNAVIRTLYGIAESEVRVIYAPNDKWDGDCLYSALSASFNTTGITIYSGAEHVAAWKDMYNYNFLDIDGGLYTFDNQMVQMHFTAGPGLYTGIAALPYTMGKQESTSYQEALLIASREGRELDYVSCGYNFILALNDDMVSYFLENGKLEKVSRYDWPGLKELLLLRQYELPEPTADEGLANFVRKNNYLRGQFLDMPYDQENWYDGFVMGAYNVGLISGYPDGTFRPEGEITIAECLSIACKMRDIYKGGDGNFSAGSSPWYSSYINYGIANGIIAKGDFEDYDAVATRGEIAHILANALPYAAYEPLAHQMNLKDITTATDYYADIHKLYIAGIVEGYPDGSFRPETNITRAEVCVIISSIVNKSLRRVDENLSF